MDELEAFAKKHGCIIQVFVSSAGVAHTSIKSAGLVGIGRTLDECLADLEKDREARQKHKEFMAKHGSAKAD